MLADEEQWSDGSDSYVLASDDDPYGHYEVVSSDSWYETEDDLLDLATEIYHLLSVRNFIVTNNYFSSFRDLIFRGHKNAKTL